MNNPRVFFFHYNKPASASAKKPQISVHWKGRCMIVDNIECYVKPIRGKINKRQPYFVMRGYATEITIRDFPSLGAEIPGGRYAVIT